MRKASIFIFVIAISSSLLFSSCGVMFGGSKYQGKIIATNHPNATIYANGQKLGVGEASSLFDRDLPLRVELKEEGCETKSVVFDNKFRTGNFILSIFTFGLLGLAVDLGTGASYKPDHKRNPNVKKETNKNFTFNVDSDCKK
jgi:hypothetical protein